MVERKFSNSQILENKKNSDASQASELFNILIILDYSLS